MKPKDNETFAYSKVTEETLRTLNNILGKENVLIDKETLERYSYDETPHGIHELPEVVVKPQKTEQVAEILKLADQKRIPVTFRGQGTGLSCGAVPIFGGLLISFERMNKIIEIDENNLMAVAEVGVILTDLRPEVEDRGLFYPADPGERTSSLGGNIATNAGGMNCVKYGKVRDYVLGLEVVIPSGKILQLGGKTVKRSSGYELMHLIIGSEGTLAAVTKVIIRLIKLPKLFITLYIPFRDMVGAFKSVSEILRNRITPTAIEFIEREVILETERKTGRRMPNHDAEAYLIIRLDGEDEPILFSEGEKISSICLENNALDILVADTKESQSKIWEIRSAFYENIVKNKDAEIIDTVIPPSSIPEFMTKVKSISTKYGVKILSYGHAGDGNIHIHPIRESLSKEEWYQKLPSVMDEIYKTSISFGGAISGEHGIGVSKKTYFQTEFDIEQIKLMKQIKMVFDPNNILNPGKIFD
jgi:glycolate oxidase